ncbi:Uncharacterised protein [Bordetella pertussis]|nr:Uncharacterised protein [Bordetella pertussis]CFL85915.1 Uncharacterised protein [Bordetella pertussis]CFM41191.1 Uncharacterised protein [Bordetella pertussis]CFM94758.1 Uncharacterised protein [Bordetella pertussis]CFN16347.1 Uncharacterised protein [Bordetella pertussis]
MRQPRNQDGVEQLGQHQHHDGDLDRGADVLLGVEAGRQDLDRQQADQAGRIGDDGQPRLLHVLRLERAVVEQGRHQPVRQQRQAQGGRQAQHQYQAQSPVQQAAVAVLVGARVRRRQAGQQHRAQRHAQQGGGKLHQPVGKRQPGHAARLQPGGDIGVDQQGNLRHRYPERGGRHLFQDPLHRRVAPGLPQIERPARRQAQAGQRQPLHGQLRDAAGHHAQGQGVDRHVHARRQPQAGRDHGKVEQHRRERRHGKAAPRVEHAGCEGDEGHAQDVREHHPRHPYRGAELGAAFGAAQSAGHGGHHPGRRHDAGQGDQHQRGGQQHGHPVEQRAYLRVAAFGAGRAQDGHEGLRERAFGKQAAQQVGNTEGDPERIGQGARAERARHQDVAHQAGDARQQGETADGSRRA